MPGGSLNWAMSAKAFIGAAGFDFYVVIQPPVTFSNAQYYAIYVGTSSVRQVGSAFNSQEQAMSACNVDYNGLAT